MILPTKIAEILRNKAGHANDIGMSGSSVIEYDDCILKIEDTSSEAQTTVDTMRWLEDKIPAAKVLYHEVSKGKSWLLMSRVPGKMSCVEEFISRPDVLINALADGMKLLWSADATNCPRIRTLDDMLTEARYRVKNGLVDMDNVEPETFGENGFRDPFHLLTWLEDNRPESVLTLAHGDYCLPNIFIDNDRFSGFIDLGDFGIGEKWRDIALCWRSLKHNADGHYGKIYDIDPNALFVSLGIEPDWQQIRYHILLDELF